MLIFSPVKKIGEKKMPVIETRNGRYHTFGGKVPEDIHNLCIKHKLNRSAIAARAISDAALKAEKQAGN